MTHSGFRLERDEARRRVVITLLTRATTYGWSTAVGALLAEDGWREPVIYDMSGVDSSALLLNLPNLVPMVANLLHEHGRGGAVAVVVRDSEVALWRLRLAGLFAGALPLEVFADVGAAHAWLDQRKTA